MKAFVVVVVGLVAALVTRAHAAGVADSPRTLAVLPSTDNSHQALTGTFQNALQQLYAGSASFTAVLSPLALDGYDQAGVQRVFATTGTDLISFVYLEKNQVTLYLFDRARPNEFIVEVEPFDPGPDDQATPPGRIEAALSGAFWRVMADYSDQVYQALPGTVLYDQPDYPTTDPPSKEVVPYSRDLSSTESGTVLFGVIAGYARLSADSLVSSSPQIGLSVEWNVFDRAGLDLGVDIFNYALIHADARYALPLFPDGVYLDLGAGAGHVLGRVASEPGLITTLHAASVLWGPTLGLGVPFGKITLRADFRAYWGGSASSIYLAGAGLNYAL